MTIENNPYLDDAINKFMMAYSKREEMERNFNSGKLEEYTAVNEEVISLASDLIKYGIDVYQKEDDFCFLIDDTEYSVSIDDLCQKMTNEEFLTMKENIKKREARKKKEQQKQAEEENKEAGDENTNEQNDESNMPNNPFTQFMQFMFKAAMGEKEFQPPAPPAKNESEEEKKTSLIDDIANIQKRILQFEHEKFLAETSEARLSDQVDLYKADIEKKQAALDQKDAEIERLIQDRKAAEELFDEMVKENEDAAQQRDDTLNRIAEVEEIIKKKNEECNQLKKRLSESDATINTLKKDKSDSFAERNKITAELKEKSEELEKLRKNVRDIETKAQNEKVAAEKEISEIKEKLLKAQNEKEAIEKNIQKEKDAAVKASEELEKAKEDLLSLKNELGNAKNELNAAKSRVKNLEKNISDKDAQLKKYKDGPAILDEETAKKIDDLTMENNRLRHEVERLKAQPTVAEQNRKSDAVYEEKIAMLSKLAYTDEKFGVKNMNAFNVDYPNKEKDKITISMVGICNMKIFNNTFGRAKGDMAIKKVADMLLEAFPSSDIYRIMGDQFTIISENMDIVSIKQRLQEIEDALESEMINIVFGTVDGVTCKDHETALKQAESAMKQMKNRSGKSSIARKNLAEIERAKEANQVKSAKNIENNTEEKPELEDPEEEPERFGPEDIDVVDKEEPPVDDDEEYDDEEVIIDMEEVPRKKENSKNKKVEKDDNDDDEEDDEVDFDVDYEDLMDEIEEDDD